MMGGGEIILVPVCGGNMSARFWAGDSTQPTVVFVHGWAGNQASWLPQVAYLQGKHPVYTIDLPGHGESREVERDDFSVKAMASDLALFFKQQNLSDVILVGHSIGGAICAETATLCANRIRAVVLGDTFIFDYGQFTADEKTAMLAQFRADLPAAIQGLVASTTPAHTTAEMRALISTAMAKTPPQPALSLFSSLLEWQPLMVWPKITIPLHAINGELIPESARARHQHVITEHLLPKVGHFLHIEQPDAFSQKLAQVVAQL